MMSEILEPNYFDAYTMVGPRTNKHPAQRWSLDHLQKEMDHCRITSAMVLSTQSVHYDPLFGNLRLSETLAGSQRLFPVWNVMPGASGEFPAAVELKRLIDQWKIKAVSIFPQTNGWDIFDSSARDMLQLVSDLRLPVYFSRDEFASYETLRGLLDRWPELRVILPQAGWPDQRYLIPLLQRYRNLHITFEKFQIHYGPEDLVSMGLEDQLLYGSDAPKMAMGAHRCYIDYADIPKEAKFKIAGGNLARLLDLSLPEPAGDSPCDDILMQTARRGEPLVVPIIDMHMHVLDEGLNGGGGSYRMSRGGPSGIFPLLKRIGCTGGGFMSWNGTVGADTLAGNICTSKALDVAPPGFWGLASFDPTHYSQQELENLIPERYGDRRFLGMKPYRVFGVAYDDARYDVWWKYGNDHGLYALIHRTRRDFSEVTNLAAKYPKVQWVVAHCGGSFAIADMAIEAIKRFPNIHAEITLTPVDAGMIDYLADGCGADRVLYGSDLPMRDPRQQLGWVVYSQLPLESKVKILGENALGLITRTRNAALSR